MKKREKIIRGIRKGIKEEKERQMDGKSEQEQGMEKKRK